MKKRASIGGEAVGAIATDCTTLSDAITDSPNTALVYFRQDPKDEVVGPSGLGITDIGDSLNTLLTLG